MLKRSFKQFITFILSLLLLIITISILPQQTAAAENNKYLVIVSTQSGAYIAYDNLALEINGSLMVKAKPLATALGISYSNGNGHKKGCVLSNGIARNAYTRNSKDYEYISSDKVEPRVAEYKQRIVNSYNLVHYDTIRSLVNCSYFRANQAPEYSRLGYAGVIVYNNSMSTPTLPSVLSVVMPGQTSTLPINIKRLPYWVDKRSMYENEYFTKIDCSFHDVINHEIASLDFSELHKNYSSNGYPADGIYGYGHCDVPITLQAIDGSGNIIKEYTTTEDTFPIDFPSAVKLNIACIGIAKPYISFTPIKPTLITDTTKLVFTDINWLTTSDGYSKQFYVLSKGLELDRKYLKQYRYYYSSVSLNSTLGYNIDLSNSYQVVSFIIKYDRLHPGDSYLCFTKDETPLQINTPLVRLYDKNKNLWAADFEQKLGDMIKAVTELGVPNYLAKSSCDQPVTFRVKETFSPSTNKEYIALTPSQTNLDCAQDYLSILHELIRFYDTQEEHYSSQVAAWSEGITEILSRQALGKLNISVDSSIPQLSKISLSVTEQTDFIKYFLYPPYSGDIGYYFITYLQKTYDNNIIGRISAAEANANIPIKNENGQYRDKERDQKFINCIKSVTSENVFNDFISYYNSLQ